jgi:transcriptional regulator with XRE-family HTH domain
MQFYSEADITANIKAERARSGLSQEDVAEKLGITRQSYNIWETNPKSLTLDKIELLAKVIGCSVTTLVIK